MNNVYLTDHAYDRLKERVGINKKAADRLSSRAYESGISVDDATGSLKNYLLDKTLNNSREGFEAKIYGDFVYCFLHQSNGIILLTTFWVPKNLKNQSLAAQKRKFS